MNVIAGGSASCDPATPGRTLMSVATAASPPNPTEGRMFLINLFGKKVGAHDPASRSRHDRIMITRDPLSKVNPVRG